MNYVLVTGATGGLGSVTVMKLLDKGYDVIGLSVNYKDVVDELAEYALKVGQSYTHKTMDLTKELPSLDIIMDASHLVITHGVNFNEDILSLKRGTIETSMNINFISAFEVSQIMIKKWLEFSKNEDNSITYISSVASQCSSPDEVAYHSAKRAMESAMRSFTRAFSNETIRFNVISPGLMDTAMGKKTAEVRPDVLDRIPLKLLTTTDEVAEMVIRSIESKALTGQNIQINAGRNMSV